MTTYEVKMGVPIPRAKCGPGGEKTQVRIAIESMPVGGMIECERTKQNITGVTTWASVLGIKLTQRRLFATTMGIWRTA